MFWHFSRQKDVIKTHFAEIVVSNTQKNEKKFGGLNLLSYIRTVKTEICVMNNLFGRFYFYYYYFANLVRSGKLVRNDKTV